MTESNEDRERDEILKRLWKMPPKPHAKITPKATKKPKRKGGRKRKTK